MTTPEKPTLDFSYTAFQQAQGDSSFPGTQLDNDLANLKQAVDDTIDFTSAIIRSDGSLNNGVVTKDALAADVLLGVAPPSVWGAGQTYGVDETVTTNNSLYICKEGHVAGTFSTDLLLGRWALIAEFTVPAAIADNAVTATKIAANAVIEAKIASGAVTETKIASGAVTKAKMAASAALALVPVGAEMPFAGPFAPSGWLFEFGQAVSRVTYAALFDTLCPAVVGTVTSGSNTITGVSVDLRNLGLEGSLLEGTGLAAGAAIVAVTASTIVMTLNATASIPSIQVRAFPYGRGDGATTFNLPDGRDVGVLGRGNMGGVPAARVTNTGNGNPGLDTSRIGLLGGVDRHVLTIAQLPVLNLSGTATVTHPAHQTRGPSGSDGYAAGVAGTIPTSFPTGFTTPPANTIAPVTIPTFGSGHAHPNLPPSRVSNMIIFAGVA